MLRLLFFAGFLALVVPASLTPWTEPGRPDEAPGLGDMVAMVEGLRADVASLCDRRPGVCDTGARLGVQMRDRALAFTGLVQGWLTGTPAPERAAVSNEGELTRYLAAYEDRETSRF